MAGIDKIYGTREQYDELRSWLAENKRTFLKCMTPYRPEVDGSVIANFHEFADCWLYLHCPIRWLVDKIGFQYNVTYNREEYEKII